MSDGEYEYEDGEEYSPWFGSMDSISSVSSIIQQVTIPERAKARVGAIDPNGGRCLVENCSEICAVSFCHCFLQGSTEDDNLLGNIEWHWNMRRSSLDLDSHFNIFRVGASLHRLYDKHFWLLLPEDDIIKQYHATIIKQNWQNHAPRESFPIIPNRSDFKYRFLVLSPDMDEIVLLRQNSIPFFAHDYLIPNDMSMHVYPFGTLPILISHIHPKFAILEAGRKLLFLASRHIDLYNLITFDRFPILINVLDLWFAWTRQRPPDAMDDETYKPQEEDPDSDNKKKGGDDKNALCMQDGEYRSRKWQRIEDSSSRIKHKQNSPVKKREELHPLTAKSLKWRSRTLGKQSWTTEAVHRWSAQSIPLLGRDHKPWKANLTRQSENESPIE